LNSGPGRAGFIRSVCTGPGNSMKAAVVSFHSCPYSPLGGNGSGGMSVYLKELTSALAGFPDVRVDIFTRTQDPLCAEEKEISSRIRVVQLKGGPERPLDRRNLYPHVSEFTRNFEAYCRRQEQPYDVLHSHYWLSGLAASQVKKSLDLPMVHTYHTLGFMKKKSLAGREHQCRASSEQHLAHASDAIVSSSQEEKDRLIAEYGISPSKVEVVHPGVNIRRFPLSCGRSVPAGTGWGEEDHVFLFVGRIEPIKGLMSLVQALALLKNSRSPFFPKTRLLVVGGGSREEVDANPEVIRIRKFLSEQALEDRVLFLGSVEQERLCMYYGAACALVVPSLYESFGLVAVEAMASGIPVLASGLEVMKALVREGKNGLLFRPGDPSSICRCLEDFLASRNSFWTAGRIRREVTRRFSWEKAAEDIYRIFSRFSRQRPVRTISPPGEIPRPV